MQELRRLGPRLGARGYPVTHAVSTNKEGRGHWTNPGPPSSYRTYRPILSSAEVSYLSCSLPRRRLASAATGRSRIMVAKCRHYVSLECNLRRILSRTRAGVGCCTHPGSGGGVTLFFRSSVSDE